MAHDRLIRTFDLAYECLRRKINGGRIRVDNEASLQLQFASILKSVGELLEVERDEFFSIELEKAILLRSGAFGKSGTRKAKIDVFFSFTNAATNETHSCAVEMKYFKKANHREPNNRYDVFADLHNLENYGGFADHCFLLVATDHDHYVNQSSYSDDTADFDFRDNRTYTAGTTATYRTAAPYGEPITLARSYTFNWDTTAGGLHFMKLPVIPLLKEVNTDCERNSKRHQIVFNSAHWRIPSTASAFDGLLEGAPTAEEKKELLSQASFEGQVWEPSKEAWLQLDEVKGAIGKEIEIQMWDPIMAMLEDEGPYPIIARCCDAVLLPNEDGKQQAFLSLEKIRCKVTAVGYDGTSRLKGGESEGVHLMPLADIYTITWG